MVKWLGKQYQSICKKIITHLKNHSQERFKITSEALSKISPKELEEVHRAYVCAQVETGLVIQQEFFKFIEATINHTYVKISNDIKHYVSEECANNYLVPAIVELIRMKADEMIELAIKISKNHPSIKISIKNTIHLSSETKH